MQRANGTDGRTAFVTLAGRSPFSTHALHFRNSSDGAERATFPRPASERRYLRSRLPAIYQDDDFGLEFLAALESELDPIVAILDCLPAHLNPELAPRDLLGMLAAWL